MLCTNILNSDNFVQAIYNDNYLHLSFMTKQNCFKSYNIYVLHLYYIQRDQSSWNNIKKNSFDYISTNNKYVAKIHNILWRQAFFAKIFLICKQVLLLTLALFCNKARAISFLALAYKKESSIFLKTSYFGQKLTYISITTIDILYIFWC